MDIEIVIEEMAAGWATIQPALSEFRKEVELERLPGLIHQTLTAWLRANPSFKIRSTLAIDEGGSTVAVHAWFDVT